MPLLDQGDGAVTHVRRVADYAETHNPPPGTEPLIWDNPGHGVGYINNVRPGFEKGDTLPCRPSLCPSPQEIRQTPRSPSLSSRVSRSRLSPGAIVAVSSAHPEISRSESP